jgi:hypothetical protein
LARYSPGDVPNSPAAILDALQSLHEAEQSSVFRLMGEGSPYVKAAPESVRSPLRKLHDANRRHVRELADAIRQLGGSPQAPPPQQPTGDESYLKYLSLKFLVPKLVQEKELMVARYHNALRALPKTTPEELTTLLRRQEAEQAANVDELQATAGPALAAST